MKKYFWGAILIGASSVLSLAYADQVITMQCESRDHLMQICPSSYEIRNASILQVVNGSPGCSASDWSVNDDRRSVTVLNDCRAIFSLIVGDAASPSNFQTEYGKSEIISTIFAGVTDQRGNIIYPTHRIEAADGDRTVREVCRYFGQEYASKSVIRRYDSPGNNYHVYWDSANPLAALGGAQPSSLPLTGKTTINQNWHIISARTTNQSVDTVTCREAPITIATIDGQATTSIPTISRSRPSIAGTGFAGNTITVVRENTTLCTAVVAANGAWTCTPSIDMAPGVIPIQAKSSRNGVNHRRQAEATFVIGCATGETMTTTTTTETIPEIKTWRQHDGATTCTDICSRRGETYTGLCSSGERTVTEIPQAWYIYGRRGDPIPGNNLVQLVNPSSAGTNRQYCYLTNGTYGTNTNYSQRQDFDNTDIAVACQCSNRKTNTYSAEDVMRKVFGQDVTIESGLNLDHGGKRIDMGVAGSPTKTLQKICELYGQEYISHGKINGTTGTNGWEYPQDRYHIFWSDNPPPTNANCLTDTQFGCRWNITAVSPANPAQWHLIRADIGGTTNSQIDGTRFSRPQRDSVGSVTCGDPLTYAKYVSTCSLATCPSGQKAVTTPSTNPPTSSTTTAKEWINTPGEDAPSTPNICQYACQNRGMTYTGTCASTNQRPSADANPAIPPVLLTYPYGRGVNETPLGNFLHYSASRGNWYCDVDAADNYHEDDILRGCECERTSQTSQTGVSQTCTAIMCTGEKPTDATMCSGPGVPATASIVLESDPAPEKTWVTPTPGTTQSCHSVCKNVGQFSTGQCSSAAYPRTTPGNFLAWGGYSGTTRPSIFNRNPAYSPLGDPTKMYCQKSTSVFDGLAYGSVNTAQLTATHTLEACECTTDKTSNPWIIDQDFVLDIFPGARFTSTGLYPGKDFYSEAVLMSFMFDMVFPGKETPQKACEYYGMRFDTTRTNNYFYGDGHRTYNDSGNDDEVYLLWSPTTPASNLLSYDSDYIPRTLVPNWYLISDNVTGGVAKAIKCDIPTSYTPPPGERRLTVRVTSPGSGYGATPPVVIVNQDGQCTTYPTATATVVNGSVTGVTLVGGNCTVAPTLTIAPPPADAQVPDDQGLTGNEDIPHVNVATGQCTDARKCEWTCPAGKRYDASSNTCVADCAAGTTWCSHTERCVANPLQCPTSCTPVFTTSALDPKIAFSDPRNSSTQMAGTWTLSGTPVAGENYIFKYLQGYWLFNDANTTMRNPGGVSFAVNDTITTFSNTDTPDTSGHTRLPKNILWPSGNPTLKYGIWDSIYTDNTVHNNWKYQICEPQCSTGRVWTPATMTCELAGNICVDDTIPNIALETGKNYFFSISDSCSASTLQEILTSLQPAFTGYSAPKAAIVFRSDSLDPRIATTGTWNSYFYMEGTGMNFWTLTGEAIPQNYNSRTLAQLQHAPYFFLQMNDAPSKQLRLNSCLRYWGKLDTGSVTDLAQYPWNTPNSNGFTCVGACTSTSAPSELKVNVGKPIIECSAYAGMDPAHTHFRYKITQTTGGIASGSGSIVLGTGGGTISGSSAGCTGTLPTNARVLQGGQVSSPRAWVYDGSPTGPYNLCSFSCLAGTTYDATTNTCSGVPTAGSPTISAYTYESAVYPIGTSVVHPTTFVATGDYTVSCVYGRATDAIAQMTDGGCDKTMVVRDGNDIQGCQRIDAYVENSTSSTLWSERLYNSPTAFNGSFACASNMPHANTIANPYKLLIGSSVPLFLAANPISSLGFPISMTSSPYNFTQNLTDITCAVKVGGGYSTADSCQKTAGVHTCSPTHLSVVQSGDQACVADAQTEYIVSCNPNGALYSQCQSTLSGDTVPDMWYLPVGGTPTRLTPVCTVETNPLPGAIGGLKTCKITLPTGVQVPVWTGDATMVPTTDSNGCVNGRTGSFQGMSDMVRRDTQAPILLGPTYIRSVTGTPITDITRWQNTPVQVKITCQDEAPTAGVNGDACVCTEVLSEDWSSGFAVGVSPRASRDEMQYFRTFGENIALTGIKVRDTAGNQSSPVDIALKIDTVPPDVTPSISGTSVSFSIQDVASGLWKAPTSLPTGVSTAPATNPRVAYKIVSRAQADTAIFASNCGIADGIDTYDTAEVTTAVTVPVSFGTQTITSDPNTSPNVIAYCVQDNAGNETKGIYPSIYNGCFSESRMTLLPTLTTYSSLLVDRLTPVTTGAARPALYGYSFSEDATRASCYRSLLDSNIARLITNQYDPQSPNTVDWSATADIKGASTVRNTNGYYYFNHSVVISSNPAGTGTKVVFVDGGDIQINNNINYNTGDQVLVLIARKSGTNGGNIYVSPTVRNIDAILIADGALMNREGSSIKNWITNLSELDNPLTINGALYSWNNRGGSLKLSGTGATASLVQAGTTEGRYFTSSATPVATTASTLNTAAAQDLERFRLVPRGSLDQSSCTTTINYRILGNTTLPPILQRPAGFGAGTCTF